MGLLKVQGTGKVFTEPDLCILSFKLKEENKDYAKCLENLNKRTKRLREAIAKNEIDIHSLKTSDFEIKIKDRYSKGRYIFDGYEGTHRLHIELPIEEELRNRVLSTIVKSRSGAEINISFSVKDKEPIKRKALKEALRVAKENAKALSDEAGVKLGKILKIEYGWSEVRIREYSANMILESASHYDFDIEPEELYAEDSVTITYEIID